MTDTGKSQENGKGLADTPRRKPFGKEFWLVVLVLVVLTLGVMVLDPFHPTYSRQQARRVACTVNLHQIGNMIALYQNNSDGAMPESLEALVVTEDLPPTLLACPKNDEEAGECSYVYRGADLAASAAKEMIVAYDKLENHEECRNVLMIGYDVERLGEDEFLALIEKDNRLRREMGLVEKAVGE